MAAMRIFYACVKCGHDVRGHEAEVFAAAVPTSKSLTPIAYNGAL
jgi:hypothetical protein